MKTNSWRRGWFPLLLVLVIALVGCAERERVSPTEIPPEDAPGYVDRGWDSFGDGDFDSALADFSQAIALDPEYGPAYVGQGWARLRRAPSSGGLNDAIGSFNGAQTRGENGADVRAGIAAAQLALGGTGNYDTAIAEAQAARAADPSFQFAYISSFDSRDLFLIEAFALAGKGSLSEAVQAANNVEASNLDSGNSATWIVDGITYTTFEGAALAFLHSLSEEHSG